MNKSKTTACVAAAFIASAFLPAAIQAAEVKLKAASFLPARVIYAKHFYNWVESVNGQCAGKVNISVVGPAAIGSLEQWNALKNGVIDMHFGPPNYYKGTMIEADVTSLANVPSAEQRSNGAWSILNELHNQKMNAWYLTHIINGVPFYVYTNKPHKDGRFDGFRLRSVPIYDKFFESLGAQPVRMPPPKVYTALERNTVDGYGWPLWGVVDFGWHEHTKYRHGPGFMSAVVNIIVNLDKWNALDGGQRQCLTDMATKLENDWPRLRNADDENQVAGQDAAGIQYVDLGLEFADQAHDLHWAELEAANADIIRKLKPLLVK